MVQGRPVHRLACGAPGLGFTIDYLPYTHAFFPQERFDEVVQRDGTTGSWTVARRGTGFIALWSARPTEWRSHRHHRVDLLLP